MSADSAVTADPPTQSKEASFSYDAFLSYNHHDEAVAAGIQKGLHRIGRRMGQLNALRVFRDSTDMAANPEPVGQGHRRDGSLPLPISLTVFPAVSISRFRRPGSGRRR